MTLLVQGMAQVRRQECLCLAEVCRTEWCQCDHPGGTGHLSEVSWNGKCPARTMSIVRSLTECPAHRMGNVLQEHYQYFSTPSTLANREPLAQTDWIRQVLACDYKCSVVWPCIQGSTDTTLSPKKPHLQEHSEALKRTCCRQPTSWIRLS